MSLSFIGRLVLWPIRRNVPQASIRPAENAASSAHPARASSNLAEPRRLFAPRVLTVSNSCVIVMRKHTIYNVHTLMNEPRWSLDTHILYVMSCIQLWFWCVDQWQWFSVSLDAKSLPLWHSLSLSYVLFIQILYCTFCPWRRHMAQTANFFVLFVFVGLLKSQRVCRIINYSDVSAKPELGSKSCT